MLKLIFLDCLTFIFYYFSLIYIIFYEFSMVLIGELSLNLKKSSYSLFYEL